jgi:MarR family transcriptional regulator for hemolysin
MIRASVSADHALWGNGEDPCLTEPIPHDDELLVLLTDVARFVRTLADRRARGQGMTRAQWLILFRLRGAPGLTQRELAVLLEVEPITVGRLVDRLEARGLIERRSDPGDRRVWRLHLTAAAAPVLTEIDSARGLFDAQATRGLTPEQRGTVIAALLAMKANLQASAMAVTAEPEGEDGFAPEAGG